MSSIDPTVSAVIAAKDAAVKTQVAFALAEKSLDAQKQQGDTIVQLVDSARQMGNALGRGAHFDATA